MYKFEFNFFKIIYQLPRVWGKVKLYRGKLDLSKKDKDITNFIS